MLEIQALRKRLAEKGLDLGQADNNGCTSALKAAQDGAAQLDIAGDA